jgi:hypothetical protein
MTRCEATKTDGKRCAANALPGRARCLFHDAASAKKTAAGRSKGGKTAMRPTATLPPGTPDAPLGSVSDVAKFLGQTMNEVRCGKLAVGVGNCLAVLAGTLIKALETSDLEKRLAALEAVATPVRRTA